MDSVFKMSLIGKGHAERHAAMYDYAKTNKRKGKKGGDCNVTACQKSGACCYNGATDAYYCTRCWDRIYDSATNSGSEFVDWICQSDRHPDHTFTYESDPEDDYPEKPPAGKKINRYKVNRNPFTDKVEQPWTREMPKVGRNEQCPCGSGKKYKKCCEVLYG